jgi:hypothetical protein
MKKFLFVLVTVCSTLCSSCVPSKEVIYFQGVDNTNLAGTSVYEPVIKPDDVLFINVKAFDDEAVKPFNLNNQNMGAGAPGMMMMMQTYLVDNQGHIDFPVLGKIKIAGMTRAQVIEMLVDEDGFIQGRNRKFNGKAMADYCRNFSIVYPNILTREFGIRQQAMYINYYNNLSNKIGIPGGEINN